ncbi:aldehyde dehydrogenase family protein [Nocardia blacklockiae]|uniref:aldehyde dehydrogenase family protein n=1 Tax=Nocardia blacklockiae TaxID=480036 RepID=UPI001894072D|nr:aldehyde dehydrogenase family protein [Nocardia blacklockiae]MBF6174949.1 aldehyde dehydrogenase family protein [Nocardia blacklockiae]
MLSTTCPNTAGEARITVIAPGDGRTLGILPAHSPEHVRAVTSSLRTAQISWRAMGVVRRVHWLTRFREWLSANGEMLAELLASETGKSVAAALRELRLGIDAVDYHRTHGADFLGAPWQRSHGNPSVALQLSITYRPCAVVGVLSPWTYPLASTLFDAVPALMAGSAVLVKPSTVTPLTVRAVADGWARLGAPPVLEFVAGHEAGPAVVDSVDYVHFTGSPETGKVVALRAAARLVPCRLALGGKSSAIVLADADLGAAAAGIALGGFADAGQSCHSIERVFVEAAVYDEFVDRLAAEAAAFGAEDPDDPRREPMTSAAHVRHLDDQVRDALAKGATLRIGGTAEGQVFAPTVLADADPSMSVLTQQTLGPILPVVRVASAEAATALANDPCGPCVSVWTADDAAGRYVAGRLLAARAGRNDVSVHLAPPGYA